MEGQQFEEFLEIGKIKYSTNIILLFLCTIGGKAVLHSKNHYSLEFHIVQNIIKIKILQTEKVINFLGGHNLKIIKKGKIYRVI